MPLTDLDYAKWIMLCSTQTRVEFGSVCKQNLNSSSQTLLAPVRARAVRILMRRTRHCIRHICAQVFGEGFWVLAGWCWKKSLPISFLWDCMDHLIGWGWGGGGWVGLFAGVWGVEWVYMRGCVPLHRPPPRPLVGVYPVGILIILNSRHMARVSCTR